FLQRLWVQKFDWEDPLPTDLDSEWRSITADILPIPKYSLDRYLNKISDNYELHCFCDASQKAYGTAIYLRSISNDSSISHLLFTKSRLAPIAGQKNLKSKKGSPEITLPRLELMGVLIGTRSLDLVAKTLPF